MPFDLRLIVFHPNGDRRGLLAHPLHIQAAFPFNDIPSLKFSYSMHAPGADLITTPCEIGLQWSSDGNTWLEFPEGRFLLIQRQGDQIDQGAVWQFDCPSYLWTLQKAVTFANSSVEPTNGNRVFSAAATSGFIMQTLLGEAQTRGALSGLTWTFNASTDSSAASWGNPMAMGVPLGTDLLAVLLRLVSYGLLDFRLTGARQLSAWNANSGALRDLSTGASPVILRAGRDVTAAPDVVTLEDMASAAYVVGDNNIRQEAVNIGASLPWGRWEAGVREVGITSTTSANNIGTVTVLRGSQQSVQRTREITMYQARHLPLRDYRAGDTILAPSDGGELAPMRVRQITLTRSAGGVVAGNLILADRREDYQLRVARQIAALSARP
ncbi:hypothetical protein AB0L53_31675 [Nonomuraea sp. NPDC052129]|uniref:hypothetical protein n=1 Tax=Nonomuraea sp. NPDC052129 TaxID=3154651 RepID=UPI00342E5200